jgi:hypothetical protein
MISATLEAFTGDPRTDDSSNLLAQTHAVEEEVIGCHFAWLGTIYMKLKDEGLESLSHFETGVLRHQNGIKYYNARDLLVEYVRLRSKLKVGSAARVSPTIEQDIVSMRDRLEDINMDLSMADEWIAAALEQYFGV